MNSPRNEALDVPVLGRSAVVVFIFMLIAFVVESELTQFVQTSLEYRHPYFLFWVVHSSFSIIFPLHLLYLTYIKKYSLSAIRDGLRLALSNHLNPDADNNNASTGFPKLEFLKLVLIMTVGLTIPGLLWFASISLASISDVTAIWNTNAFFAYLITVKLFDMRWEPRKLLAVVFATIGVVIVVYGGSSAKADESHSGNKGRSSVSSLGKPTAPFIGDILTLFASFGYGLYQALYKKYVALPSDPEVLAERQYESINSDEEQIELRSDGNTTILYPPPFGLHPNLMTAAVGLATLVLCWVPLPLLHWFGVEPFALPHSHKIIFAIAGISLSGVVFNASLMILLAEWGAIITSVGNLLTIVMVMLSDLVFGAGLEALTFWSVLGSGVIVCAFSILAYDMAAKE